ncbi:SGNH/GDSL hydrolase family protein [Flavobacterium johnsoniae]|uniref:SGNH/GDSL hydrolase family protein n=1 Tax=Flavobacterium johnsoniae TaxID=986 RepID=UPI003D951E88
MFLKSRNLYWFICLSFLTFLCQSCDGDNNVDRQIGNLPDNVFTVIMGSSSAYGVGASLPSNSWAQMLQKAVEDTLYNLSYPGYTTYKFLPSNVSNFRNISPDNERNISAALKLSPKIIIFSITTNDIASGYSIDEYLNNIKIMTDLCAEKEVEFIITSTLPRNPLSLDKRKALYDLNRKLEEKFGERYLEIFDWVANPETYTWKEGLCASDFIHPNDAGHMIIYQNVLEAYKACKLRILEKKEEEMLSNDE